ncbi:VOC family protein [Haloglycomyces albus]|uniref:VOC family protein n=1 Tax=Haloglycomyces albus TaxID=526067 RepID=UPI00046CD24F|nr:VOC family protein [Haloglycomyces albus]
MLQLTDFIIDCPDPMKLATFYSKVTGFEIVERSDDFWASIRIGDMELAFYRVDEYHRPSWPDDEHPKQFHIDFEVDEFEPEHRRVIDLGATFHKSFVADSGFGWKVYTDPVGHPFCLCRNNWSAVSS